MSEEILISFIVTVYNGEKTISACLNSILQQSQTIPFEIIVINDGSEDLTFKIIENYKNQHSDKIKIIHQNNKGPGKSRNEGIHLSSGEYLAFIDGDDSICADYTDHVNQVINTHRPDMLIIGYNRIYERKKNFFERNFKFNKWNDKETQIIPENNPSFICKTEAACWLKIINRRIFIEANDLYFSEIRIGEDLEASLKWYLYTKKVIVSNAKLYNYYIRSGSLNGDTKYLLEFTRIMQSVCELYKSQKQFDHYQKELEYIFTMHILISNLLRLRVTDRKDKFKVFMLLRSTLIQYFPKYTVNKYLKSEPFYVRIAVYFSFNFPEIYRLILYIRFKKK